MELDKSEGVNTTQESYNKSLRLAENEKKLP